MDRLKGKRALITSGTTGIGFADSTRGVLSRTRGRPSPEKIRRAISVSVSPSQESCAGNQRVQSNLDGLPGDASDLLR